MVAAAREHRPDVALLDIEMPGLDGIAADRGLRAPCRSCRVLVVTTFGRPGYLRRAMAGRRQRVRGQGRPGARSSPTPSGGCTPGCGSSTRLAAESLATGESPAHRAGDRRAGRPRDGGTVADIAVPLLLSEGTVRNHLSAAIGKTRARTRAEAVRLADANGWL